jgi:hypothetical protein
LFFADAESVALRWYFCFNAKLGFDLAFEFVQLMVFAMGQDYPGAAFGYWLDPV